VILREHGIRSRKVIDGYNLEMVNAAMVIMAGVTIVAYIMYTSSTEVMQKFGQPRLYLTALFVVMGILRYLQITFVQEDSGSPTRLVLRDTFIQLVLLAWLGSFFFLIY